MEFNSRPDDDDEDVVDMNYLLAAGSQEEVENAHRSPGLRQNANSAKGPTNLQIKRSSSGLLKTSPLRPGMAAQAEDVDRLLVDGFAKMSMDRSASGVVSERKRKPTGKAQA